MNNVMKILNLLDKKVDSDIELTLYGRAALLLGFEYSPEEFALTRDVDAIFWIGQAEMLLDTTNFWQAVEEVNLELADQDLYISHFFVENQVILGRNWPDHREKIDGEWKKLTLYRLGNTDLLLSKLMRDDPIDIEDAIFIYKNARLNEKMVRSAIRDAIIPDIPEIKEQFESASANFIERLGSD